MFGALLGLAGLVNWAMVRHVVRRQLLDERARDVAGGVSLGVAIVFLLSVPVALISTLLSYMAWVATIFVRYPIRRLGR